MFGVGSQAAPHVPGYTTTPRQNKRRSRHDIGAVTDIGAGGNDVLQAGNNTIVNRLFGDALDAIGNVTCGDDVLIGGNGFDYMWGDAQQVADGQIAGADRFVFAPGNDADTIYDFESGQDLLDLTAFGFAAVEDIQTTFNPAGDFQI